MSVLACPALQCGATKGKAKESVARPNTLKQDNIVEGVVTAVASPEEWERAMDYRERVGVG